MRILGIDCGTERTGYGIIDSDGRRHSMIAGGVIATDPQQPLSGRLKQIACGLREVIVRYRPEAAAVESVFYAANARTALRLAHVRGVALLSAAEAGLPVGEYSPLEIKTSVVGYGRAQKHQVSLMVRSLLGLTDGLESDDVADALAVAICHATRCVASAAAEPQP